MVAFTGAFFAAGLGFLAAVFAAWGAAEALSSLLFAENLVPPAPGLVVARLRDSSSVRSTTLDAPLRRRFLQRSHLLGVAGRQLLLHQSVDRSPKVSTYSSEISL